MSECSICGEPNLGFDHSMCRARKLGQVEGREACVLAILAKADVLNLKGKPTVAKLLYAIAGELSVDY